jgi:hypothetical protein
MSTLEAYKVAVQVAIDDQITKGLATIGKSVTDLLQKTKDLEKALNSITKASAKMAKATSGVGSGASQSMGRAEKSATNLSYALATVTSNAAAAHQSTAKILALSGTPPVMSGGGGMVAMGGGGALALYQRDYGRNEKFMGTIDASGGGGGGGGGGGSGRGGFSMDPASHRDAMVAAGMGYGGAKIIESLYDASIHWERELARLKQMGLGDQQIADAEKYVRATQIIGTSMQDRLRIFVDAQGSFRESGRSGSEALIAAKEMMPLLAGYEVASSTLSGDKKAAAQGSMQSLNKALEIMGGIGNTEQAKKIVDGVFKAVQSSGRMVDERQLKQFVAYGGSATNQQTIRTIFGGLEPIIGEFGGSQTAVGLRTAYGRMNGMMSHPPRNLLQEMNRLGLADATGSKQNHKFAEMQSKDAVAYAQELMKVYQAHGITSVTDRERENAILLGGTGSKIYNKIMSQMPVIQSSLSAYDSSNGVSATLENNKRLLAAKGFENKLADLQLALGRDGGVLDMVNAGLNNLADTMESIAHFSQSYPNITKLGVGLIGISSVLAIVGSGVIFAISGLGSFARVVGMLGKFLFANPIGMAIGLIITTGLILYDNWKEIKKSLSVMWVDMKNIFNKVFSGDFIGAFHSFAHMFLQGWQVLFNTLIVQINTLLPKSMEVKKFSFADTYAANHLNTSGSPNVRTGPGQPIHVATQVNMDGFKVASIITKHQAKQAARPLVSGSQFDSNMNLLSPSFGK